MLNESAVTAETRQGGGKGLTVGTGERNVCVSASARRASGERGAALVETAILIPVVLMITFGLIEFSSAYQSSSTATAASRVGGPNRVGGGAAPDLRDRRRRRGRDRVEAVPADEPVEMWIYQANDNGLPGRRRFDRLQHVHDQVHQVHLALGDAERSTPRTRAAAAGRYTQQNACNPSDWDSVGVYVKLNHKFLTRLFGANITLTDHAVFRLEPAPTQLCP